MPSPVNFAIERKDSNGILPGEPDFDRGVIRKPGKAKEHFDDDLYLVTRGDADDLTLQLKDIQMSELDQHGKDVLLQDLLEHNNEQAQRKRDIELRGGELDLENRKRFSELAAKLVSGFGIVAAIVVMSILWMVWYALSHDKNLLDMSIIGTVLSTFSEIFKTVFAAI